MAEVVEQQQQNVVDRLINLPLVSSTCDAVSSAYVNTKDGHPYLKSVCDVAENSVRTITTVAVSSAKPILQKLEPQISMANNLACIGLDKIEVSLPILHQPSNKVVANASEAVVGAKDAVIQGITEALHDSVAMTKAVVNGSINTVLGSTVVHRVSIGVDSALSKSESLLEQYFPPTDELVKEDQKAEGFEVSTGKQSYYVRLGSLSTKARTRAYQQAVTRIKDAKCRSQEAISQLQITVDLIEFARKNMNDANQTIHNVQEQLYDKWVEWIKNTGQQADGESECTEHIESRTLILAKNVTLQLQTTCLSLMTSVQGLPQNIQNKAQNVSAMAADVYQNFRSVSSFKEMSDSLLNTSREQFTKMKGSMDDVMDYLVNNTPLNWLVGPFYSQLASDPDGKEVDGADSTNKEE